MSDKCYMCGADATGTDSEGDICGPCYAVKLWQGDEKLSPKGVTNVWNYPLFRHMSETYQLTLVESELNDIMEIVMKMNVQIDEKPTSEDSSVVQTPETKWLPQSNGPKHVNFEEKIQVTDNSLSGETPEAPEKIWCAACGTFGDHGSGTCPTITHKTHD